MGVNYIVPQGCPTVTAAKAPHPYEPESPFSAIFIGTGCPEIVLGRGFPATLIQYKGAYFLVDVGEGTNTRLIQGGIANGLINNVLFTHHHADHNAGYPYFIIDSWMIGRQTLNLVGPPKTRELHELVLTGYKEDIEYRASRGGVPVSAIYAGNIREIEDKDTFELDGVTISTAKLTHTAHNIGYRFEADGMVIVVSGDTSYDPALVELARDADLLILDAGRLPHHGYLGASIPGASDAPPKPPEKRGLDPNAIVPHPMPGEVARMATEANVKALALTHYIPMAVDEEKATADIRKGGFTGELYFARDLMELAPEKETP